MIHIFDRSPVQRINLIFQIAATRIKCHPYISCDFHSFNLFVTRSHTYLHVIICSTQQGIFQMHQNRIAQATAALRCNRYIKWRHDTFRLFRHGHIAYTCSATGTFCRRNIDTSVCNERQRHVISTCSRHFQYIILIVYLHPFRNPGFRRIKQKTLVRIRLSDNRFPFFPRFDLKNACHFSSHIEHCQFIYFIAFDNW